MKVHEFIKWLEKQDQSLEVCVVQYYESEEWCFDGEGETLRDFENAEAVCFDDPVKQSTTTQFSLTLGIEK